MQPPVQPPLENVFCTHWKAYKAGCVEFEGTGDGHGFSPWNHRDEALIMRVQAQAQLGGVIAPYQQWSDHLTGDCKECSEQFAELNHRPIPFPERGLALELAFRGKDYTGTVADVCRTFAERYSVEPIADKPWRAHRVLTGDSVADHLVECYSCRSLVDRHLSSRGPRVSSNAKGERRRRVRFAGVDSVASSEGGESDGKGSRDLRICKQAQRQLGKVRPKRGLRMALVYKALAKRINERINECLTADNVKSHVVSCEECEPIKRKLVSDIRRAR